MTESQARRLAIKQRLDYLAGNRTPSEDWSTEDLLWLYDLLVRVEDDTLRLEREARNLRQVITDMQDEFREICLLLGGPETTRSTLSLVREVVERRAEALDDRGV